MQNTANQLVKALTHGPIPEGLEWQIMDSGYDDDGSAWAILKVDDVEFNVMVSPAQ